MIFAVQQFFARFRGVGGSGTNARMLEPAMAVRHDYACKKCEKTFTAWDDSARVCAYCGSKRVFKVFLTPPAASTGNAARIDKLAEKQLDAAGLSNYTNAGGSFRRSRRTHPSQIAAVAAAKANNLPFSIETGPAGRPMSQPLPMNNPLAQGSAARGKGHVTYSPQGSGALVQNVIQTGKRISPLTAHERIYHPKAIEDGAAVKELMKK